MHGSMVEPRQILHLDMDAFFAAVEVLDDGSLRGRPLLVGGPGRRGVVAAASYEARRFGVHSAMSMGEALRRCPSAVVVPPRHARYAEISRHVFDVFRRYTPLVEGLSVDEAFLDVTASRSLFGDGETIARAIKRAVVDELGLTISAGVASSKFAAKIASDLDKPDGLVVVPPDVAAFLAPLSIERMWGVGPKAAAELRRAGLSTIGDLARTDVDRLTAILGARWGAHVQALARGLDDRDVEPDREAVSVGAEETFDVDLVAPRAIERHLLDQAGRVARRLLEAGVAGRTVTVKLKYADFTLRTRQMGLPEAVADTDSIYRAAVALLDRFPKHRLGVRLTGISVSNLEPSEGVAPSLFPDASLAKRRRLEEAVAAVRRRIGTDALVRAALLERDEGPPDPSRGGSRRRGPSS